MNEANVSALQRYANHFIETGWTIGSMTDQQFIATKREDVNILVVIFGFVGLLFYVIPGLLILLLGYVARGTETQIVTDTDAQTWQKQKYVAAEKNRQEKEAKIAANEKRIAELSESPLRFWYKLTSEQRALLIVVIFIIVVVLFGILTN